MENKFEIDEWKVIERNFDKNRNKVSESIFSLANEYMGTRGNLEEGFAGDSLEGCYIGGIYYRKREVYPWKRKGFPEYAHSIASTVNWLKIKIEVAGESFNMMESTINAYYRGLDMKKGILRRELVFISKSGYETRLEWERGVSYDDKHLAFIKLWITPLNHSENIAVAFEMDARLHHEDSIRANPYFNIVSKSSDDEFPFILMKEKNIGHYYITRMLIETGNDDYHKETNYYLDGVIGKNIEIKSISAKTYEFVKFISIWTSRDAGYPHGLVPKDRNGEKIDYLKEEEILTFLFNSSSSHMERIKKLRFDQIFFKHCNKLDTQWSEFDIEIKDDRAAQQGIRFAIFQLLGTYRGFDSYLNIGPKGYTGEIHDGRAFWDSEAYCLPFYLFSNPDAARNLLDFRHNTLNQARARAREFSYLGAMFPMTTMDGTEDCPLWEFSLGEIHINSIMAYAVFLYCRVGNDLEYLYSKGIEVLIEISRFWASRAVWVPRINAYAINRVTGPDEFQQLINNNWYTNYLAKWVLNYCLEVIDEISENAPETMISIKENMCLKNCELLEWARVADKMLLNIDDEMGIYIQDDMFLNLDPICREELDREKDIPIESKWTTEKILKRQLLKQPDVLMGLFLFRDNFKFEDVKNNYRFYEQCTSHGSSLSPCVHSILASDIGRRQQAYEYYLWSARLDLDDRNNNTDEGLHITAMAGAWMTVVCGFGGLVYTGEKLSFNPKIPRAWGNYSFKLNYQGRIIEITVGKKNVDVKLVSGESLTVNLYGEDVNIGNNGLRRSIPEEFLKTLELKAVLFRFEGIVTDETQSNILPGIARIIKELKSNGIKVATFSTKKNLSKVIENLRFAEKFDNIFSNNELGYNSIDVESFSSIFEQIGIDVKESILIDKDFDTIKVGRAAGLKTLGIGYKTILHIADYTLSSSSLLSLKIFENLF